ncbi:MAG: hypothetical protein RSA90_04010 [Lachnospiraceae bacterium]
MAGLKNAKDYCMGYWKYHRANFILGIMCVILMVAVSLFFLTKDKAPVVVSAIPKERNEGCKVMQTNPLAMNQYDDVNTVVQHYYERLADDTEFVEQYENVQVYTKLGQYKDTYIVFAYYEMKIKDIYTKVPGLETLYVSKGKDDILKVETEVKDDKTKQLIEHVMQHDDIQMIINEVQIRYASAVQSDATLQEALSDLQQAYKDGK